MIKRKSLGRGLDKLLPISEEVESLNQEAGKPLMVDIKFIDTNPEQPRRDFNDKELASLSQSIKIKGIIEPLVVQKIAEQRYQIIAGERRLRAAKLAELKEVPVIIKEIENKSDNLELALIENLCREDLNPIEEAESFQRLELEFGKTHKEIADMAGRDRVTVTNAVRLLKLPEYIQDDVRYKRLSAGHARAMLGLVNKELIDQLRSEVITKSLTVRQTEALVKKLNKNKNKKVGDDFTDQAYFESLAQSFTNKLGGLKVKIDHFSKTKKLEIYYSNNEELEFLMHKMGVSSAGS